MKEKSLRFNKDKLEWSLVDFKSLEIMVQILQETYKKGKYPRDNWKKGMELKDILDSLFRHVVALMDGEEYDQESGRHHIGHILCNCMFYQYHFNKIKNEHYSNKN